MTRSFLPVLVACFLIRTVSAADFAVEVMDATFKLFHPDSTATCFFVHREAPDTGLYLVTAAHTLERTKGSTAVVVLRKGKEDGSFDRLDFTIPIRQNDKPLWIRHPKYDVAVLRLAEPPPVAIVALPVSVIADEKSLKAAGVHVCSPLFILTYPQRFEANAAGFPVARQGIFASPPTLPVRSYPTFLADFTAFAGDSGGPVFTPGADGHPLLVGIVLAQFRHDERVKTEFEERTIHHPLGLGTVLHGEYIREAVEAAASQKMPEPVDFSDDLLSKD